MDALICGNCGGREGRNGEWSRCPNCGFDVEYRERQIAWVEEHGEPCNVTSYICQTCGEPHDEQPAPVRDAWRCNDCGYVGAMHEDAVAADAAFDELVEQEITEGR